MKLEKNDKDNSFIFLLFTCALAILAYVIDNNTLKIILFALIFYSSYLFKNVSPTLLLFSISSAINFEAGGLLILLITLPAYINRNTFKIISSKKGIVLFFLLLFIIVISFLLGVNTQFKTILLLTRCILVLFTILSSDLTENQFKLYTYFKFFVIVFLLLFQFKTGTISFYWGRLALNGNVRELANVIAVPTFVFGISLFDDTKGLFSKILNLFFLGICLFIMLATSSRGVLFSTIIAVFIFYFSTGKRFSVKKVFSMIMVAILIILIVNYISSLDTFNIDRILEDKTGGFNGRTDIWAQYLNYEFSSIKTALFGFGPGDIKRLGISSLYSHSLFFDWLFSFGCIGALYFLIFLVKMFCKLIFLNNKFCLSLFLLGILLFSTHGIITDILFYIIIGVACHPIYYQVHNQRQIGGDLIEKEI